MKNPIAHLYGYFSQFVLWCSGVNQEVLTKSGTNPFQHKSIGMFVVFTAVYAGLAGGYAGSIIFQGAKTSIVIGILWGLAIFNMDRFVVGSMVKYNNVTWDQKLFRYLGIVMRMALAGMIAFTVSVPLEVRLFEKEITEKLTVEYSLKQQNYQQYLDLQAKLTQLQGEEEKYRVLETQDIMGAEGSRYGVGQVANRIKEIRMGIAEEKAQIQSELNTLQIDASFDIDTSSTSDFGFFARYKALEEMKYTVNAQGEKKQTVYWGASWVIRMILFLFELLPIINKLMLPQTRYDILMQFNNDAKYFWELESEVLVKNYSYEQLKSKPIASNSKQDSRYKKNGSYRFPIERHTQTFSRIGFLTLHREIDRARKEKMLRMIRKWRDEQEGEYTDFTTFRMELFKKLTDLYFPPEEPGSKKKGFKA